MEQLGVLVLQHSRPGTGVRRRIALAVVCTLRRDRGKVLHLVEEVAHRGRGRFAGQQLGHPVKLVGPRGEELLELIERLGIKARIGQDDLASGGFQARRAATT